MIITPQYLEEAYQRFNNLIFAGRLPRVELRVSSTGTCLGNCKSTLHFRPDGTQEHRDIVLQVSSRFDLQPVELDSVIVHEMIHLFIMVHNLPDTGQHGEIFRAMMNAINARYGLCMSVKAKITPENKTAPKAKVRVVARLILTDGSTALKVLPKVAATIRKFRHGVLASGKVRRVDLFFSDNVLFGRYPSSGALRIYPIDSHLLDKALEGATPLTQL